MGTYRLRVPASRVGYRRRRAACPQGPTYCTYWVRVPASAVPYVPTAYRGYHPRPEHAMVEIQPERTLNFRIE